MSASPEHGSGAPRRLLVAGCGYVGIELARQWSGEVWGLRRDPRQLPGGIRPIVADLLDPELGRRLPRVDAVAYVASADASEPESYRRAYVDGVRNLLTALDAQEGPAPRLVFASSTAVYGDAGGDWVDEATPAVPDGFRGEIVLEGEEIVLGAGPVAGGHVVVRLGGIYGPGRRRLIDRVLSGTATCPEVEGGGGGSWSNRIHRDDAAGILGLLLTTSSPAPIYLGVDVEPAPLCDVYEHVARLLGVPPPRRVRDADRRRSDKRCSSRRIQEAGYPFRYPTYREGYGAMLG